MRSSSSVVIPTLAEARTSSSAWAAIFEASLIFEISDDVYLSPVVCGFGAGRQAYSGRVMPFGTLLTGERFPGVSSPDGALGIGSVYFHLFTRLGNMTDSRHYWFNTKTNQVEFGFNSLSLERLGPFETEAEAKRALEIIQERARAIREQDLLED